MRILTISSTRVFYRHDGLLMIITMIYYDELSIADGVVYI